MYFVLLIFLIVSCGSPQGTDTTRAKQSVVEGDTNSDASDDPSKPEEIWLDFNDRKIFMSLVSPTGSQSDDLVVVFHDKNTNSSEAMDVVSVFTDLKFAVLLADLSYGADTNSVVNKTLESFGQLTDENAYISEAKAVLEYGKSISKKILIAGSVYGANIGAIVASEDTSEKIRSILSFTLGYTEKIGDFKIVDAVGKIAEPHHLSYAENKELYQTFISTVNWSPSSNSSFSKANWWNSGDEGINHLKNQFFKDELKEFLRVGYYRTGECDDKLYDFCGKVKP